MKKTTNHIEEYFATQEGNKEILISKEIFNADKDVDIKTDLSHKEIVLVNKLFYNSHLLKSSGLKDIYKPFLENYLRLKISLERKSRGEFVAMNSNENMDKTIEKMSNLSNITGVKK